MLPLRGVVFLLTLVFFPVLILAQPANDLCPGSVIASLPYSHSGSTTTAHNDYHYGCPIGDANDVVYHLSLADCYEITASLCGSAFNTQLIVRSQEPCPGNFAVTCNDDYCGQQSQVTFVAHGGFHYFLIVDGVAEAGNYVLNVTGTPLETPTNDVCPGTLISSLPFTDSGNSGCATNDYDFACPVADHREVVYTLNVPMSGMATVSLCSSDYNTMVVVRTGGACPGVQQITCNDDFCGLQSQVSFYVSAGTDYFIFVDGVGQTTGIGNYVIDVTMPAPGNDNCAGNFQIHELPWVYESTTMNALTDYELECPDPIVSDVIFKLILPCTTLVTASLCSGTEFDAQLYVFSGEPCPGHIDVGCDYLSCAAPPFPPRPTLTFTANANTGYYLIIGGNANSAYTSGNYRFTLSGTPCPAVPDAVDDLVIRAVSHSHAILDWSHSLSGDTYRVYRGNALDFPLDQTHLIATPQDTHFVDLNVFGDPVQPKFYVVTVVRNP